jgi:hypothetical protein
MAAGFRRRASDRARDKQERDNDATRCSAAGVIGAGIRANAGGWRRRLNRQPAGRDAHRLAGGPPGHCQYRLLLAQLRGDATRTIDSFRPTMSRLVAAVGTIAGQVALSVAGGAALGARLDPRAHRRIGIVPDDRLDQSANGASDLQDEAGLPAVHARCCTRARLACSVCWESSRFGNAPTG